MSAIIKTLKTKTNETEQSVYPKTVLEAVVDSETNETLDVILDGLNNKIDNIETGGGGDIPDNVQEQIDGKVSKSGDTMTGALEVSSPDYPPMTVTRSGQPYSAAIRFKNSNGVLGAVGMSQTGGELLKWSPDEQTIDTVLDTGNYDDYAVPKTGGAFTGDVTFEKNIYALGDNNYISNGYINCSFSGGSSTGYWKFLTLTAKSSCTYAGSIISFKVTHRSTARGTVNIYISNTSTAGSGFSISMSQDSSIGKCYFIQSSTGVFDIYLTKKQSYDNVTITDLVFPKYQKDRFTLTWSDTHADSLPDGATEATPFTMLDSNNCSNYAVPKTGGSMTDTLSISSSNFPMINLTRSGVPWTAGIKFNNSLGVLGAFGMSEVDGCLMRYASDISTKYDVLDTGNYSSYALPLTGGTVTGATTFSGGLTSTAENTVLQQDYYCFQTSQGAGSTGYWKLCTINITNQYANAVIEFDMTCRYGFGKLYVSFSGATDISAYTVGTFKQTGGLRQCYIVKTSGTSSGSVFDIYVAKEEAWGNLTVNHMKFPQYMRGLITLTWSGAHVSSLPSGYTAAKAGNDWTTTGTATGASFSITFNKYSSYIVSIYNSLDMYAMFAVMALNNGSFKITSIDSSGSFTTSLSGTTLTISGGGITASTVSTYKMIELK